MYNPATEYTMLYRELAMMTTSTENPDEMTKLVMKVMSNPNRLIQMLASSRALPFYRLVRLMPI
jgi:hypothetical protein